MAPKRKPAVKKGSKNAAKARIHEPLPAIGSQNDRGSQEPRGNVVESSPEPDNVPGPSNRRHSTTRRVVVQEESYSTSDSVDLDVTSPPVRIAGDLELSESSDDDPISEANESVDGVSSIQPPERENLQQQYEGNETEVFEEEAPEDEVQFQEEKEAQQNNNNVTSKKPKLKFTFKRKSTGRRPTTRLTKQARAGIVFPVGRIKQDIKRATGSRIGDPASIAVSAAVEYIMAEIMELAAQEAKNRKRKRITPQHINFAISNDEALKDLFKSAIFAHGGHVPAPMLPYQLEQANR